MDTTTSTTRAIRTGNVRRAVVAAAVATVATGALVATAALASAEEPDPAPAWNALEHEARRSLAEAEQEAGRVLNPHEHEAHRPATTAGPAGRVAVATPCALLLSQAWEELGHFSDGMETFMLTTSACR